MIKPKLLFFLVLISQNLLIFSSDTKVFKESKRPKAINFFSRLPAEIVLQIIQNCTFNELILLNSTSKFVFSSNTPALTQEFNKRVETQAKQDALEVFFSIQFNHKTQPHIFSLYRLLSQFKSFPHAKDNYNATYTKTFKNLMRDKYEFSYKTISTLSYVNNTKRKKLPSLNTKYELCIRKHLSEKNVSDFKLKSFTIFIDKKLQKNLYYVFYNGDNIDAVIQFLTSPSFEVLQENPYTLILKKMIFARDFKEYFPEKPLDFIVSNNTQKTVSDYLDLFKNVFDKFGKSLIHTFTKTVDVRSKHIEYVIKNINPNISCLHSKDSVLHIYVKAEDTSTVNLLLQQKRIYLNPKDKNGETPLQIAVRLGNSTIITLLLQAGANPNIPDNKERTTAHITTFNPNGIYILPLLIQYKVNLNKRDKKGHTPLDYANYFQKKDKEHEPQYNGIVKLLEDNGAKNSAPIILLPR